VRSSQLIDFLSRTQGDGGGGDSSAGDAAVPEPTEASPRSPQQSQQSPSAAPFSSSSSSPLQRRGAADYDSNLLSVIEQISLRIPAAIDATNAASVMPMIGSNMTPIARLAVTESLRYNALFDTVSSSLAQAKLLMSQGPAGLCMSEADLEVILSSLSQGQVPSSWQRLLPLPAVAASSGAPLSEWLRAISRAAEYFSGWLRTGSMSSLRLAAFSLPRGVFMAISQCGSRFFDIGIVNVSLHFLIDVPIDDARGSEESFTSYVLDGLTCSGFAWNRDGRCMADPPPVYSSSLPSFSSLLGGGSVATTINNIVCYAAVAKPETSESLAQSVVNPMYSCPVYASGSHRSQESLIVSIPIPTKELPLHWSLRGAALACSI
jgi:hypothetical protein